MKAVTIRYLCAALSLQSTTLFADYSRVVFVVPGAKFYKEHHERFLEGGDIFANLQTDKNAEYRGYPWSGSMLTSNIMEAGYDLAQNILNTISQGKHVTIITFSTGAQVAGAALRLLVNKPIELDNSSLINTMIGSLQESLQITNSPETLEYLRQELSEKTTNIRVLEERFRNHFPTILGTTETLESRILNLEALQNNWIRLQSTIQKLLKAKSLTTGTSPWGTIDVTTVGAPFCNPLDPTTNISELTKESYGPINVSLIKNFYSTSDLFILGAGSQFKEDQDPRTFYIEVKFQNGSKATPFSVNHYFLLRNETLGRRLVQPFDLTEGHMLSNRLDWILPYEEAGLFSEISLHQPTIDTAPSENCCGRTSEHGTCCLLV